VRSDLLGKERELTLVAVLRVCAAGVSLDADDVAAAEELVLVGERAVAGRLLGLAHDLHADALGANIVEAQVGTRCTLVEDTGTNAQCSVLEVLARLEVAELGLELAQIVVDVELVRVGVGLVAQAQLLDGSAADLKVLVGVQVGFLFFGAGSLLLGRRRCRSGCLLGLLGLLFTLLLALLDWLPLSILCTLSRLCLALTLGLADLLASHLVDVQGGRCGIVARSQLADLLGDVVDCLLDSVSCCLCLVGHDCCV
jgi:hypothetical protein